MMAMAAASSAVTSETVPTAEQWNNLRTDVLATMSFWSPATGAAIAVSAAYGNYPVIECNAANEAAGVNFYVPENFLAFTTIVMVVIPTATTTVANWDLAFHAGIAGGSFAGDFGSDTSTTYNVTADQIFEIDLSTLLSGVVAGQCRRGRTDQVLAKKMKEGASFSARPLFHYTSRM